MTQNNKNQFINLNNAREDEQREVMEEIRQKNHCPFCLENLKKYHQQPILQEGQYWLLTSNQWPYQHTLHHFLIIYKEHGVRLADLTAEAGQEFFNIIQELEKKYQIKGGAVAMRFGDTDWSAGTVNHLHAQFLVPDIEKKDFEPIRFKVGLQWEKRTK